MCPVGALLPTLCPEVALLPILCLEDALQPALCPAVALLPTLCPEVALLPTLCPEEPTPLPPSAGGVLTSYLHWAGATNPTTSTIRRSPYQLPAFGRSYQPNCLHQQEESHLLPTLFPEFTILTTLCLEVACLPTLCPEDALQPTL